MLPMFCIFLYIFLYNYLCNAEDRALLESNSSAVLPNVLGRELPAFPAFLPGVSPLLTDVLTISLTYVLIEQGGELALQPLAAPGAPGWVD